MPRPTGNWLSHKWHEMNRAQHDMIALFVSLAAIVLFVAIAGNVLPKSIRALLGMGHGASRMLIIALLLNVALIIFAWRRYKDLHLEVLQRRQVEQEAFRLAYTDPMTGCLNRRAVIEATEALMKRARGERRVAAFLMLDLDNFKTINDVHGHKAGDLVLTEVASRARELLPADAELARLGGDEFACVLTFRPDDVESVDRFAGHLIDRVAQPIDIGPGPVDVTISVGIVGGDQPEAARCEPQELMHMADIAMYHAKKHGRNRYCWFEPSMESELKLRSGLETGIRRGIANGEFVPFYEQQIDLETGRLVGFEMLARWQSPTFGLIHPEVFIPIAEEIGVISDLSEMLIRQALIDAREWAHSLTLSVNISPIQMRDPWFDKKLLKLLVEGGFPPERLEVEITESCLHENIAAVSSMVQSLKNQGISVSLDDFGTGYSSLSQLQSLPFDRIKVDRSFISSLGTNREATTIVQAIASLGEGLNMPIVVEGVENREVLAELRKLGSFKGQGYLYGFPEDAAATRQRLKDRQLLASSADRRATDSGASPARRAAG